jgi:hypothetical protein
MPRQALGITLSCEGRLDYHGSMVEVRVHLPDDVASRAKSAAEDRGVTVDELASEALEAYLAGGSVPSDQTLSFIGLGLASNGFSAREAEEQLEAEGFGTSPFL